MGDLVVRNRRKRRARGNQGPAFGPADEIRRLGLVQFVGFESGKIMGRSQWRAICLTMSSVKAPGRVEVPIRMVGLKWVITSARVMRPFASVAKPATSSGFLA